MDHVEEAAEQAEQPRRSPWVLPVVLAVVAVLLVGGVATAAVALRGNEASGHAAATVGPLHLDTVDAEVAAHYTFAEDHRDLYSEIPCYCGCEDFLGHRHLADCFLLADGTGYEPHAAGCGVCLAESALVRQLLADGADPADVPAAVIERFGATPPTAPTT